MGNSSYGKQIVACYTLKGKLVRTYKTAKEAAKLKHLHPRSIDKCIRGDTLTCKNLLWRRVDPSNVPETIEPYQKVEKTSKAIPIAKIDENGNILEVYPSIKKAGILNNIDPHSIRYMLSGKYEYNNKVKFRYLENKEIE